MKKKSRPELQSRQAALDLLSRIIDKKQLVDDAFAGHDGLLKLEPRDRSFVRNVVSTTLRRLGQIDDIIAHLLNAPLAVKARMVQHLLRLGVCQLVFLKTPPHAAVDTAVELAQHTGLGPYKKLINAVLRRTAREALAMLKKQNAARLNTPDWLWQSWQTAYGDDVAKRIGGAHLSAPPLDITVNTDVRHRAEILGGIAVTDITVRLQSSKDITGLPGFDDGEWWVQDLAATVPVKLLGDVTGKHVIDLCAAPGGKTMQLIQGGARVNAVDRSNNRIKRLRENLSRVHMNADIVVADACQWRPETLADMVLLDAPCSATGTLRRHPELGLLKSPDDVLKLAALQTRLLAAASEMIKVGGKVVFSTCSLQAEECQQHIIAITEQGLPLKPIAIEPSLIPDFRDCITNDGTFRSFPFHKQDIGGMDGFFAVVFEKV